MLLATIGLLIASLALLIAGFAQDAFPYTYGAIACAALAAVLLVLCNGTARNLAGRRAASAPGSAAADDPSLASSARAIARLRTSLAAVSLRNPSPVSEALKPKKGRHAASSLRDQPPVSSLPDPPPVSSLRDPPPVSSLPDGPPASSLPDGPPVAPLPDGPPVAPLPDPPPVSWLPDPPPASWLRDPPPVAPLPDPPPVGDAPPQNGWHAAASEPDLDQPVRGD